MHRHAQNIQTKTINAHSAGNAGGDGSGNKAPAEGSSVEEKKPAASEEPPRRKKSRFAPPPTGAVDLQAGEGSGGRGGGRGLGFAVVYQRVTFVSRPPRICTLCIIRCVSEGLPLRESMYHIIPYPTQE